MERNKKQYIKNIVKQAQVRRLANNTIQADTKHRKHETETMVKP